MSYALLAGIISGADRVLACQVEVKAERNSVEDQSSLLLRYQQEIQALRIQLDETVRANKNTVGVAVHDPLHPEVSCRTLCPEGAVLLLAQRNVL